ncbi:MAG: PH domain-containing protein, partial [Streptomycetaceae bacterium]|nr:PH domain-containing protein [Streptomycetaceae bacterium]
MTTGASEADGTLVFREHWRVLVRPVGMLFAIVAAGAFLASISPGGGLNWVRIGILVVGAGALLRFTVVPWLRWLTDQHVVADGRLVVRSGLWTQEGRALALARIADVSVTQDSFLERVLGIGTLVVTPDDDRDPIELVGLPRAADARQRLLALAEA